MEGNSNQSDSLITFKVPQLENTSNNCTLPELEENGFNMFDEKVEELINKDLAKIENLLALKLLFDNSHNQFSPRVLRNSLVALADPKAFDFFDKLSVARLELHLRTWIAVLERICITPMRLSKDLRDKVYDSLAKFAEIHNKTTQVMQEGIYNIYRSGFSQFNQLQQDDKENENFINKRNYNIDFLLIHLRDTLHSLRDDENWFQEIIRRTKEILKAVLNITPGILSAVAPLPNDNCSILSMLVQLRKGLQFKYPVASYYVDWRIMLIIQYNLYSWSGSISKKFQEMVLMEYLWSYLEKEWIDVTDKSILDSQPKFEEIANKLAKVLRNTGSFINDLAGNEPLALPHTLWFGILDLAQSLIQKSTRECTHGLCYYLAIESLNRAPSSFIQFKAIEILFHLYNINNQMFSMIEIDFDQYIQKLNENSSTDSLKFQNLLKFVKSKCSDDFDLLNSVIGEGKGKGIEKNPMQNANLTKEISKSGNILEIIANEMTCSIGYEPTCQLCVLKCQHILSLDNLKNLKQKKCPECREKIEDNDIRYLSQNVIYKHFYSQFFEAGHILPSIELDDSANNQYDSDSDDSGADLILSKKKKILNAIKLNPNISIKSIFQTEKKQHPTYQNAMKELGEKNYNKAEHWCKEFLKTYPESYSIRCILAYIYRCLNDYEQALLYLNEAIKLKGKRSIAWYIRGEVHLRQGNYNNAISDLQSSINYKAKINNIYMVLGISYHNANNINFALKNFNILLQNESTNYLCLKYCAYIYEKQVKYSNTLKMLDKLLSINEKDSLILCYYGEILGNMGNYKDAIIYFTKANNIDPENIHNLNKRAIAYFLVQEYDKALLDLNKVIQLDFSNSLAYCYKGIICYKMRDITSSTIAFNKYIELNHNNNYQISFNIKYLNQIMQFIECEMNIVLKKYENAAIDLKELIKLNNNENISLVCILQKYSDFWLYLCNKDYLNDFDFAELGIIDHFNIYMYEEKGVYFVSNLMNLNSNYQFQKSNLNRHVLSLKGNSLSLPKFNIADISNGYFHPASLCDIIWKINIKKIISSECFIKFIVKQKNVGLIYDSNMNKYEEYILYYKKILELEGLGWIEYVPFQVIMYTYSEIQFLIETKENSIDMQIDYVRFGNGCKQRIHYLKMDHLLSLNNNTPEAFGDKYFSRKETENLLELRDIINNL